MKEKLLKWAQAGDGDCAYKLAMIYQEEGDTQRYRDFLKEAAESKYFDAEKEYAALLAQEEKYEEALVLYKELAETFRDEESMEKIVDMCESSQVKEAKETLKFILSLIEKCYNDIYYIKNIDFLARTWTFQTRRHDECTREYLQAVERRRIAARIRKLLGKDKERKKDE